MAERAQYWVITSGGDWSVKHNGKVLGTYSLKTDAIAAGEKWAKADQPSELLIQDHLGKIQDRRTYGDDPYPPKG